MPDERLINIKEASEFLGVSKYTLYGWVSARRIPFHKAGSLLKFAPSELLGWTKNNAQIDEKILDRSPKNDQRSES